MFSFVYSTFIDPFLQDIRSLAPEFSRMKTGDRVLDVCCGTGDQTIHYARGGIVATGVDLSPGMIRMAEKNRRKHGIQNASFQIASATSLPFKNNSYDYASICFALHEKERTARDRIISEMKRVVRKGGILVFIDFQVPLPRSQYIYLIELIEFIVGRDHYRYFKDYVNQGGLDEILRKNQLHQEKRDYIKNGLVTIISVKNV